MSDDYSVESLQSEEQICLAKFRQKANELRALHGDWSAKFCFTKSIELLPRTANRYLWLSQMLQARGIPMQPLR
jgi:hypothetical protein